MRYQDPKLRALLAGEYVLGTLHGASRRRFERLLLDDAQLRALVEDWQRRLNPLAERLAPVTPPARVWHKVQESLRGTARNPRPGRWRRVEIWRPAALAASLLLVSLGLYNLLTPGLTPTPDRIAVLSDNQAQAAWLVSLDPRRRTLTVKAVHPASLSPGKALELWVLPATGGGPPRSLGLLPAQGSQRLALDAARLQLLNQAGALAVSLEPGGGSPSGLPTGPVLYQGPWLTL